MNQLIKECNQFDDRRSPGINLYLDINECSQSPAVCHQNAICTNTKGSYSCQCETGYTGDGIFNCTGTVCYMFERVRKRFE